MNINDLIKFIPYGKEKGVSKKELSKKLFGMSDKEITKTIEKLRDSYIIFVNDKGKYYRPNEEKELQDFIKAQKKKKASTNCTLAIAYAELNQIKGASK